MRTNSSLSQRVRPVGLVMVDITSRKPSAGRKRNIGNLRYVTSVLMILSNFSLSQQKYIKKLVDEQLETRTFLLNLLLLSCLFDAWYVF